jgi:2-polyprenyl-3-methyl-5-hydroxy-6-metoxy-1,4-benzoquinol methylase
VIPAAKSPLSLPSVLRNLWIALPRTAIAWCLLGTLVVAPFAPLVTFVESPLAAARVVAKEQVAKERVAARQFIAQDEPAVDEPPVTGRNAAAAIPQPVEIYKGRRVAQTMHFLGAEWLIRNTREREERCSIMLATLGVKRGMTICDMGCGNGFYTLPMAKMVGTDGHVYGVDIQPEMLKMLNDRGDREGVRNFTPILGAFHDPRLPKSKIDLILCVDVYHEFSYPEPMLRGMRESLAPGGTVVLVEYRGEDPQVPIKPEHKMTKPQIMKELNANGFKLVKQFDKLPWQHMMWFARDDDATLEAVEPTLWNAGNGNGPANGNGRQ